MNAYSLVSSYLLYALPGTITYSKKSLAASHWRLLWQRSTTHQHKPIKFSLDPLALFFIFLVSCLLRCLLYSHLLLPGNASLLPSHCEYLTSPLSWQSVCCPFQTSFIGNDHWSFWSYTQTVTAGPTWKVDECNNELMLEEACTSVNMCRKHRWK